MAIVDLVTLNQDVGKNRVIQNEKEFKINRSREIEHGIRICFSFHARERERERERERLFLV